MLIVVVGEGMLELSRGSSSASEAATWRLGYGGDTLNTAIHLARGGDRVAYLTALGADPFSDTLRGDWQDEGLDTSLILTDPARLPGLYAIRTDSEGERTFNYWRGESAARQVFALPGARSAMARAEEADLLAFSLISLAILPDEGRSALLALAKRMRGRGKQVAFDGNYRPKLWADAAEAGLWRDQAIACCSIGLPTLEDEIAIQGTSTDAAEIAARWHAAGADAVVVKMGAQGCLLPNSESLPPPRHLLPVDTSGAGDAFNAGYLHALLRGADQRAAGLAGHRLAGWVVMRAGAVPPRESDHVYATLLD
ncbi:2-dehydro-3-deoxygluconokinase [Sphingomonas palmae]|uniref:2-dehydro-3-deoxygluconokinase n=1 Tax=Sphingomonas palmae TaxID=1855283 RepID=A0A1H7VDL4_9SPHN|nr:sugar kinase [Sphingomonas palmae]SEM06969.1 2-dehydro-3-deoxygluconokinase [Sphingomonas palmae]